MLHFIAGFFIGGFLGTICMGLVAGGSRGGSLFDDYYNEMEE